MMVQIGAALPKFLIANGMTAYLPYRIADDYVAAGKLHFVKDSPSFPFPAYAVWTENKSADLIMLALDELRVAAKNAPWIELENKK